MKSSNQSFVLPAAKAYMCIFISNTNQNKDITLEEYLSGELDTIVQSAYEIHHNRGFTKEYGLDENVQIARSRAFRRRAKYILHLSQPVNEIIEFIMQGRFHECIICAENYNQWEDRQCVICEQRNIKQKQSIQSLPKIEVYKGAAWPDRSHTTIDDMYIVHEGSFIQHL